MTQSWIDYIPPEYLDPEREDDLIEFLKKLPLDPMQKKYIYLDWCYTFGKKPDHEKVKELLRTGRQPL